MSELTIAEVASQAAVVYSLFSAKELSLAEEALFYRAHGKLFFKCQASKAERAAKPEEFVRQLWIARLKTRYRYPAERIAVAFPVAFGRDETKRADLVVFDKDKPNIPYIIIETKKAKEKEGKEQLKSYCHATGAPIGVWSNGEQVIVYHRKDPNHFTVLPDIPAADGSIEELLNEPWTIDTLIQRETDREKRKSLKDIILDMEDEALANAGVDVFDEVFKLVFTKLYDELACYRGRYKHLRFRNTNTESDVRRRIAGLFDEARKEWEGVFPDTDLNPEALMVFLRSPCVQVILKCSQDGSNHPRFHEDALLSIPVPPVVLEMQGALSEQMRTAYAARREAAALLAQAKRAVEIAIEQDEAAAMEWLEVGRESEVKS